MPNRSKPDYYYHLDEEMEAWYNENESYFDQDYQYQRECPMEEKDLDRIRYKNDLNLEDLQIDDSQNVWKRIPVDLSEKFLKEIGLTDKQREVFLLRLNGHTQQEIADMLGLSQSAIKHRCKLIKKKIENCDIMQLN